jgi:uncharacterized protein (TIGR00251 family)
LRFKAAAAVRPKVCMSESATRTLLTVAVTPNAKNTQARGWVDGVLKVRLAAPPIEGRANQALCEWVAQQLGLPKRSVSLRRGDCSRLKQIEIAAPSAVVGAWLEALNAEHERA